MVKNKNNDLVNFLAFLIIVIVMMCAYHLVGVDQMIEGNTSNDGWNNMPNKHITSKTEVVKEVGVGAVMIFFVVIAIIWMLVYSLGRELNCNKSKKEKTSYVKTIIYLQIFGFIICACLMAFEEQFIWGIVVLTIMFIITLCYWSVSDDYSYVKYQYIEKHINKDKIQVNNQKYRLQIFLSGSWDDTAWGGNDETDTLSRAKDILENNRWGITKVRVRRDSWKGEIIKEFTKNKSPEIEIIYP